MVISEQGKEPVVSILETGHDRSSVGILSGRALVSLRFSPGSPVGEPLNALESNELSLMPNRKSLSTGPMSAQPIEHSSTGPTQQLTMVPTVGEQQRTPLPKDQQARADAVRTANCKNYAAQFPWKQRLALRR